MLVHTHAGCHPTLPQSPLPPQHHHHYPGQLRQSRANGLQCPHGVQRSPPDTGARPVLRGTEDSHTSPPSMLKKWTGLRHALQHPRRGTALQDTGGGRRADRLQPSFIRGGGILGRTHPSKKKFLAHFLVFMGPWTVTRSPLRMLCQVAAFCGPLRPVLLPVSFPFAEPSGWRAGAVLDVA